MRQLTRFPTEAARAINEDVTGVLNATVVAIQGNPTVFARYYCSNTGIFVSIYHNKWLAYAM